MITKDKLQIGDVIRIENSNFVVCQAHLVDGGMAQGFDKYPDGYNVKARRLFEDMYDVDGDVVEFYQSGCFQKEVMMEEYELIDIKVGVFQEKWEDKMESKVLMECLDYYKNRRVHEKNMICMAFIEFLEVCLCGSIGGFDKGQTDQTSLGRITWLQKKFGNRSMRTLANNYLYQGGFTSKIIFQYSYNPKEIVKMNKLFDLLELSI